MEQVTPMAENTVQFDEAFSSGVGGVSLECICGRTHYAPDSMYVSEEESLAWRQIAKTTPQHHVIHEGDDMVSAAVVNHQPIVRGCECQWLIRFERVIWAERERILRYFKLRRDHEAKALTDLDSALSASEGAARD
jgi:hypothetical protein